MLAAHPISRPLPASEPPRWLPPTSQDQMHIQRTSLFVCVNNSAQTKPDLAAQRIFVRLADRVVHCILRRCVQGTFVCLLQMRTGYFCRFSNVCTNRVRRGGRRCKLGLSTWSARRSTYANTISSAWLLRRCGECRDRCNDAIKQNASPSLGSHARLGFAL